MEHLFPDSEKISTGLELILNTEQPIPKRYTVIVRYNGDIRFLEQDYDMDIIFLLNQFAIVRATREEMYLLVTFPQILYVDITRQLSYEQAVSQSDRAISCFPVRTGLTNTLSGDGICVAVIDSGLDLLHPAFRRPDGRSRILSYWDQNQAGNPPPAYGFGTEYDDVDIQSIQDTGTSAYVYDRSGHGTAVASIVSALANQAMLIGVATRADTAAFLCAIDYVVRFSISKNLPLVINLSYGNNYGDHLGNSQVENYLDLLQTTGKIIVVTGMGNEGSTGRHIQLSGNNEMTARIYVSIGLQAFNLQLWSEFGASYTFYFIAPNGQKSTVFSVQDTNRTHIFTLYQTSISLQIGMPSPYNIRQEVFISFSGSPISAGSWQLAIIPQRQTNVSVNAWLPAAASTSVDVFFETPTEEMTLTIPASAQRVISVGAYDSRLQTVAPFSGRGIVSNQLQKPDLVAPGVDIRTAASGGGYGLSTGTSFATPFVSAAAALLMQWGITDGNDPFLYGERVKAYLHAGAVLLPGLPTSPNAESGFGALCANNSLPL